MAKPISIVPVSGCIMYKGVGYLPTDPPFACDADEAKRLIAMGVAAVEIKAAPAQAIVKTKEPEAQEVAAAAAKVELLAAIAAAATIEEVQALLPEEEPEADVQEAFSARLAELEAGE